MQGLTSLALRSLARTELNSLALSNLQRTEHLSRLALRCSSRLPEAGAEQAGADSLARTEQSGAEAPG